MSTLREIINRANAIADEGIDDETVTGFVNTAISEINVTAKANYPYMSHTNLSAEIPLGDKWAQSILIPFVTAQIKQMDASQFEYNDNYARYERMLNEFISQDPVPDQYKDWGARGYLPSLDPETGEQLRDEHGNLIWVELTSDLYHRPPNPWERW